MSDKLSTIIKEIFEILNKHSIPDMAYTEEHDEVIYFYNKDNHLVMFMPKQDWLDILCYNKNKE